MSLLSAGGRCGYAVFVRRVKTRPVPRRLLLHLRLHQGCGSFADSHFRLPAEVVPPRRPPAFVPVPTFFRSEGSGAGSAAQKSSARRTNNAFLDIDQASEFRWPFPCSSLPTPTTNTFEFRGLPADLRPRPLQPSTMRWSSVLAAPGPLTAIGPTSSRRFICWPMQTVTRTSTATGRGCAAMSWSVGRPRPPARGWTEVIGGLCKQRSQCS